MWPLVALALYQGYQSYQSGQNEISGLKEQQLYREQIAGLNNRLSSIYSEQALLQGYEDIAKVNKAKTEVMGAQRVALAGQGIDIQSGSAAELLAETEKNAAMDLITVKNNAWLKSYGIKLDAEMASLEGRMMAQGTANAIANTQATTSLNMLQSGIQAAAYARGGAKG